MGRGAGAKGTPAYMAPELLDSNTVTEETDVYAYALVIWEVLTGDIPWRGLNPVQVAMQILTKQARPAVPEGAPADLVALMVRCWAHEPDARPTFAAIKAELLGIASPHISRNVSAPDLQIADGREGESEVPDGLLPVFQDRSPPLDQDRQHAG